MSHEASEDLRPVYLFDRFRVKPGLGGERFVDNKRWFRDQLRGELGWTLLAAPSLGLENGSCNFWRIKSSNDLRLGMEQFGPRPRFGEIRDALASEEQHLLAPLRYDPGGPQGPPTPTSPPSPSAAPDGGSAGSPLPRACRYLLETFSLKSLEMEVYDQFVFPMFSVRELLEAKEYRWRLVLAGVRLTGAPGSLVHLWRLPAAADVNAALASIATKRDYRRAEAQVINRTVEVMTPAGWDEEETDANRRS